MRPQVCSLVMAIIVAMIVMVGASAQVTTFEATIYITTIAGTGVGGYNGDGKLATSADLKSPFGVVVNSLGEVVIADTYNFRIRKILLNGTITTIAGNGTQGYNGDGILATDAFLSNPYGVTVNSLDEVLIADTVNNRIRKILLNGTITTIAGSENVGYTGDGILATDATLGYPFEVTVNSLGEILFAEIGFNRIRKILLNGTITTIAGTGNAGYNGDGILATDAFLSNPYGVTVNSLGEVLIADTGNNRIRKILLNGTITTIAGTGVHGYNGDGILATDAKLYMPVGVKVNSLGEVIFADSNNLRIRKILLNGLITTIVGPQNSGATCGDPNFSNIVYIALNSLDEVLMADLYNNRVRKLSSVCPLNSVPSGQQCNCVTGYFGYGQYCDKYNCSNIGSGRSDVCSSNGKCVSPNHCTCNAGYFGTDCEMYHCNNLLNNDARVCSSFGSCIAPNNCTCNTGYYGADCEQFNCNGTPKTNVSSVCSGFGQCTGPNICTCNSGWNGTNCEIPLCDGIQSGDSRVCNGHGSCDSKDLCKCSQGWGSTFCNVPICNGILANESSVCNGHGSCSDSNQCVCSSGYGPLGECKYPICYGILSSNASVCNGNGVCSTVDTCVCQNGFVGKQCSLYYISSDTLSVSFNSTQEYILESNPTTVRIAINNLQFSAFYNTRSLTVRCTHTLLDSAVSTMVVVSVVFPASSSSTIDTAVPPFAAVGKVSVSVQLIDTESGIFISDNVQSTNTLSIINRSRVGSASQPSYLIGLLVCLAISLFGLF